LKKIKPQKSQRTQRGRHRSLAINMVGVFKINRIERIGKIKNNRIHDL
jgi:hypothetical protein